LFYLPELFSLLVLSASLSSVSGWGRDGHALVADIAQSLLSNESSTFVQIHLPSPINGNMSNVSVWADNILYADTEPDYLNWQWSAPLHYVNTKDWTCVYDRQNDCYWNSTQGCVDGAIQNYTKRLGDSQLDSTQLHEALKFVIHFIGDVHQPLHGGFETDLGGNTIRGTFFGQSVNLHSLWDTTMIQRKINTEFQSQRALYLQYLISQMNSRYAQDISAWIQCSDDSPYLACSSTWIQEDAEHSCTSVYRDENGEQISSATGFNFSETYYNTRMSIVELRLIQAGVRLAAVINKINEKEPYGNQSAMLTRLSFPMITLILMCIVLLN